MQTFSPEEQSKKGKEKWGNKRLGNDLSIIRKEDVEGKKAYLSRNGITSSAIGY